MTNQHCRRDKGEAGVLHSTIREGRGEDEEVIVSPDVGTNNLFSRCQNLTSLHGGGVCHNSSFVKHRQSGPTNQVTKENCLLFVDVLNTPQRNPRLPVQPPPSHTRHGSLDQLAYRFYNTQMHKPTL